MITTHKPYPILPIGKRVVAIGKISVPTYFNTLAENVRLEVGTIVMHLPNGGFVVKFDNYPHAWDYSNSSALNFKPIAA